MPCDIPAFAAVVRRYWRAPFAWGTVDCCTFAADAVHALTGRSPLRGMAWANRQQALAVLRERGGLLAAVVDCLGPPQGAPPLPGDVGLHHQAKAGRAALCVWCGTQWRSPGPQGLVVIEPDHRPPHLEHPPWLKPPLQPFNTSALPTSGWRCRPRWPRQSFYTAAIAASSSYAAHQRAKAKANYNAGLADRVVMTKTAGAVRSVCYGQVRNVEGVLFDAVYGTNSEHRTLVVAVAGHQVEDIPQIWLNDTPVTLTPSGFVKEDPWAQFFGPVNTDIGNLEHTQATAPLPDAYVSGSFQVYYDAAGGGGLVYGPAPIVDGVIDTSFGIGESYTSFRVLTAVDYRTVKSYIRIRKYLGAPTQDISAALYALHPDKIIVGRHKFNGIALLLVEIECGKEDARLQQVPNVSATVKGARVYDPRTATVAYSENLALITRDWTYRAVGGNMPFPTLRDSEVQQAATVCDLPLATAGAPVPLYHGGIVCPTDQDPWEIAQELAEGMGGDIGWSGGEIRLLAGTYRSPSLELGENDLSGLDGISFVPQLSIDAVYNAAAIKFADASDDTYSERTTTTTLTDKVTEDGTTLTLTMDMRCVTLPERVSYISGCLLRDMRNEETITLPLNHRALVVERYDNVFFTLDRLSMDLWEGKVISTQWSRDGGVMVTLKAVSADTFPDPS